MNIFKIISKKHYFRKTVIYFLIYCLFFNTTTVLALDSGNLNSATGLNSATWGNDTVLNIANGAVLNWNNFNTSSSQSVTFNQPGMNAAVLNRVSGSATQFDGLLSSNGRVFLVNQSGIIFGGSSRINVNQLVASGLSISNDDFQAILNNPANLMIFNGGNGGNVTNNGTINANSVYLIGKNVINNGLINCSAGTVLMAAGDGAYFTQDGSSIIIEVDSPSSVTNTLQGTVQADNGKIMLAAGDTYSSAISNLGTLVASGGDVTAKAARIENGGTINVSSTSGNAGNVNLKAAEDIIFTGNSVVKANAGISNTGAKGGDITANSEGSITVNNGARFEAKGGSYTDASVLNEDTIYDAGEVDITGEHVYIKGGSVDASTTANPYNIDNPDNPGELITITPKEGHWAIDFPELTITDGSIPTTNVAENTLYKNWIEGQSNAGTNLELVAHSTAEGAGITVDPVGTITGGSGDITLRTKFNTGGITFLPDIHGTRTTIQTNNGGSIYMLAGSGGITTGDITTFIPSNDKITEPGKIRIQTNNLGQIETGTLSVSGGSYDEISIVSCGDLTINGPVQTITNQVDSDSKEVGQARTCLVSINGDVTINGAVTVNAHGKDETNADVHISAGRDVTVNLHTNESVSAYAKTSEIGPASASILIYSGTQEPGTISIGGDGPKPVKVNANSSSASVSYLSNGTAPVDEESTLGTAGEEAYGKLQIFENYEGETPDCPKPPDIPAPIEPKTPEGADDSASTTKYDSVAIDVLKNDQDSSSLEIHSVTRDTALGGTARRDPYGGITYEPPSDLSNVHFNSNGEATDTFTYTVKNSDGLVSGTITVTVTLINNLPQANPDTAVTLKSYSSAPINILSNDSDADSLDNLTLIEPASMTTELGGTFTINSDGTVTYNPPEDLSGITFDENGHATDSFTYKVTDSFNDAESTVHVTLVNNLPQANSDTAEAPKTSPVTINVLNNDTDADILDNLTLNHDLTSKTSLLGGTITINPDGTVTYKPPVDLSGITFDENGHATDLFNYVATDSFNESESLVTVTLINNLPGAASDIVATNQNNPVSGNVLNNDTDLDPGDSLTVVIDGVAPKNGNVILNEDGSFTYTPNNNYVGEDYFAYILSDGYNTSLGTVIVRVGSIPVAPLPTNVQMDISGCPALIQWAAKELKTSQAATQIWVTNTLASPRDIQPCDACANLRDASIVLKDSTFIDAIARIVDGIVPTDGPISEEQMASITTSLAGDIEANTDIAYAKEYIDSLQNYIDIINVDLKLSRDDSITVAVDNYIAPLAEKDTNLAVYLTAMLTSNTGR